MSFRVATIALVLVAAPASAGCGSSSNSSSSSRSSTSAKAEPSATAPSHATPPANGSTGAEGIPLENGSALAAVSSTAPGTTVDGIHCTPREQLVYHIHAHLQVYVEGQPRSLPGGIGMVQPIAVPTPYGPFYGSKVCYYWLHTHASDGVIHIESPALRLYTLGQFFDEWGQPLSGHQVASAKGTVTALINGQLWTKTPRELPLLPHAVIQLDVGPPRVPFGTISWAGTIL